MSSEGPGAGDEAYCINCGEAIAADTNFCPECGSEQDLSKLGPDEQADAETEGQSRGGVTSWAIGFEPGMTGRNVAVGFGYFFFYPIGIPMLAYGYLTRNDVERDEALSRLGRYGAWGLGVLLILAALGNLSDPGSIVPGIVSLVVGLFLLPPVRSRIEKQIDYQFARWSVVLIVVVGLATVGATVPDTATQSDTAGQNAPSAADSSPEPEFAVRVIYGGSWQGAVSVTGGGSSQSESISGTGTRMIDITGNVDIISVNAQKQDDSSAELTVQILHEGDVVVQSSTSSAYGVAQVSESFY